MLMNGYGSFEYSTERRSLLVHLAEISFIQRRKLIIFFIDLLILTGSFLVVALYKPSTASYLSNDYLVAFGVLLVVWSASSFYFKKYTFKKKHRIELLVRNVLLSNFMSTGVILVFIAFLLVTGYSRLMLFGTIGLATILELVTGNLYHLLIKTKANGHNHDLINPPASAWEIENARTAKSFKDITLCSEVVKQAVEEECGSGIYDFMCRHLNASCDRTLLVSTSSRFNIELQPENHYRAVVNMKRVNDIRYINKFFESVNRKLPEGGDFIGCAETKDQRKKRILKKYPLLINRFIYLLDYMVKRVFPKFFITKKIYYLLTRGHNRVLSRAEIMGRLYSCGFSVLKEEHVDGMFCFYARKTSSPVYDLSPTYGPFIKLRRVGKNGEIIRVYKFRTMHPYAEYLQGYIFENNNLDNGGKYKDDFRVTTAGKIMRALWIDELPMFFNFLKGEVKLVGVRPLSMQYYRLYDNSLQERRTRYKPGLIPPFYSDMPETLEEIQDSEIRYLDFYDKNPRLTDLKYFLRATYNIAIKRARSK